MIKKWWLTKKKHISLNILKMRRKFKMLDNKILKYQIKKHLMIAGESRNLYVKNFHLNFADKCAKELCERNGWWKEDRLMHRGL